jgi:iron(III) transport system permease protein
VERQLEEAGDASGASRRTVLGRIVLPLVLPVYLNGLLLVFVASIQHLTIPLMLFTPDSAVLSTVIWREWDHGDTSMTAALGVVMVIATVGLSLLLRRLRGAQPA